MYDIEKLRDNQIFIDGRWVLARPIPSSSIIDRLKDAIAVFKGKADAVKFYKQ